MLLDLWFYSVYTTVDDEPRVVARRDNENDEAFCIAVLF